MSKERPILFKGDMVRAILDDQKIQTRRIIKPQIHSDLHTYFSKEYTALLYDQKPIDSNHKWPHAHIKCPYGVIGDSLWVRETFACRPDQDILPPSRCDDSGLWWKASISPFPTGYESCFGKWRPSIHMPRWASRISLEITGIGVERVQDITHEDARSEGVEVYTGHCEVEYIRPFKRLWNSINAKRGYGWDLNPWVWVVHFKRIK